MDPAAIAAAVVAFLSPYLIEGGKAAAKKIGGSLVGAIERSFKGKPAAQEALDDMKNAPQDGDVQAALRLQLKKVIKADEALAAELEELLKEAKAVAPATYQTAVYGSGTTAIGEGAVAAGERGVAIDGDAHGPIVTGDHSKIERK